MDREAVIGTESDVFAQVLADTAADARVPTCPEWAAGDLLWHLTEVQLFWAGVLGRGARTDADVEAVEQAKPARPATLEESLALRQQATDALLEQLRSLDDAEPRWSWFEADQTVGFTRRMQTYEATMHRVDAELTAGRQISPITPDVAAGAVDHAVDVMWGGWMPDWAQYEKRAVGEFVATDTGQRWLVELGHWFGTGPESGKEFDEGMATRATTGTPTITVQAPVTDLALWSWVRGGSVEIAGRADAQAALDAVISHGMP
ncbi:maleylpyruvate isomerase family mycothiol-dependent enzyme [Microlunatus sp. Gsoil 973]|uniref:maleylpyruvate isomerase family mycothiol-dependent enzyme n=1 Tax=Microlunatus sp. Gsoil 973 TaxID=2672569 RepID=UPI0012B4B22F|nr:maleylpyruvate isomerase family mycothiol-dependent enzyme [Microlunatus sp. Gsoil 973]QGN31800.1 maleylpyruvate isomerase family mycothiol-dependent enzyme [Microlunatus sp. Gsoil 973]